MRSSPMSFGDRARNGVSSALAALPVEHRAVVTLTFFHGYSYGEIASIVQCPPNTVKTRMFHAREHLRRLLPRAEFSTSA